MATDNEAIFNECIDDYLIINVIKSKQNMKERPDCSSICNCSSVHVKIPPNPSNELIAGPVSYELPLIKDIGKPLSLNSITRPKNGADKNNQHEKIGNLTTELTALKLFVQDQFYIMKKQLEETFLFCLHVGKYNMLEMKTIPKPS